MDDPKVVAAIAKLCQGGQASETEAKQLLHVHDDHAFIWNSASSSLLAISLRRDLEENRVQNLHLSDTPLFDVERVVSSVTGRYLCLYGRRGVTCVELPRRSGKSGRFSGGQSDVTCRAIGIAQRSFVCASRLVLQQAQFHPGSVLDCHLVVLTSDNQLRLFNVDQDHEEPEQVIRLGSSSATTKTSTTFFAESALSVKSSIGEGAVGFAFAPPVPGNEEGSGEEEGDEGNMWPVFVLNGNGEVFCLVTVLGIARPEWCNRVIGPLSMYPEAADNYGADSCAILCLHPLISSPPLLVIATSGGTLYHCVVLNKSSDVTEDAQSQISQWSSSTLLLDEPRVGLYVYESVELEIGLTTRPGEEKLNELRPFDYPMLLHADPTTPARYFCSHKAGVHCVGLPMVTQLAEMAQQERQDSTMTISSAEQESIVEHLICTQVTPSSVPCPVLGVAVHYPPTSLFCLLSSGKMQSLNLASPYFDPPPPLMSKSAGEAGYTSPLKSRNQGSKEPYDQRIKMILKKETTLPLMKGGPSEALGGQECLDIVTRSTQILREEYLLRLEVARADIERRTRHLLNMRHSQVQSLIKLEQEKHDLREKAADLSERYEDLKDGGDKLQARVEVVLQKIQRQIPGLSDAEFRMQRQMKDLDRKTKDLSNAMEQIKSKEKYQVLQIEVTERQSGKLKANSSSGAGVGMGDNQLSSIKDVLQQDSQEISEMVKKLNLAKKDLSAY